MNPTTKKTDEDVVLECYLKLILKYKTEGKKSILLEERYNESADIKNVTGLPSYSGPASRGRWSVSWRERRQAGYKNTARFGWYSKKKS